MFLPLSLVIALTLLGWAIIFVHIVLPLAEATASLFRR